MEVGTAGNLPRWREWGESISFCFVPVLYRIRIFRDTVENKDESVLSDYPIVLAKSKRDSICPCARVCAVRLLLWSWSPFSPCGIGSSFLCEDRRGWCPPMFGGGITRVSTRPSGDDFEWFEPSKDPAKFIYVTNVYLWIFYLYISMPEIVRSNLDQNWDIVESSGQGVDLLSSLS